MPGTNRDIKLNLGDRLGDQVGRQVFGKTSQHQVDLSPPQQAQKLDAGAGQDLDLHVRRLLQQPVDHQRHDMADPELPDANRHAAGQAGFQRFHVRHQEPHLAVDPIHPLQEQPAGRRGDDPARLPLEQPAADMVLDPAEDLGERRLGQPQFPRRRRDRTAGGDGADKADVPGFHREHSRSL